MALASSVAATGGTAHAGGFTIPDNGTEPLGRGGAFTAKADTPQAMYYNVAGIARQEGIRLTIDANLVLQDIAFTRTGVYPGDPNATNASGMKTTPWAGQKYPTVHNDAGPFLVPSLGAVFPIPQVKNLAIGFGVYGPPSVGKQSYGTRKPLALKTAQGMSIDSFQYTTTLADGTVAPTPSRYDLTSTDLLLILPTLGIAWGPSRYIDIGAAAQLLYGTFNLSNANLLGRDDPAIDSYGNVKAQGISFSGLASVMVHPTKWMDIGVHYTPGSTLKADGTIQAFSPPGAPVNVPIFPITFQTTLPHRLNLGIRVKSFWPDGTERMDLELDGNWEKWSDVQADTIHTDDSKCMATASGEMQCGSPTSPLPLGNPPGTFDVKISHNYRDTFGARLGGAYNHRIRDDMRLTGRLGFYFDSAASHLADNHLDFNTAAKYAFTVGGGFRMKGFTLNLAYAFVYSPDRNVTNGELHPINALSGSNYLDSDKITPNYVYNNGLYHYSTHIVSIGLSFNFNEFKAGKLFAN